MAIYSLEHYLTAGDRKAPVIDWLQRIRDVKAKVAVIRRLGRLELGNFGDHKFCRDGVWELRVDVGPGYRVYYAKTGLYVVLLLCGGDKGTQQADIQRAVDYWQDWKRSLL